MVYLNKLNLSPTPILSEKLPTKKQELAAKTNTRGGDQRGPRPVIAEFKNTETKVKVIRKRQDEMQGSSTICCITLNHTISPAYYY